MTLSLLLSAVVSFLFALFCSWHLLLPFFERTTESELDDDKSIELRLKKEKVLTALAELEHDYLSGKVTDGDYSVIRGTLMAEAAGYISRMEGRPAQDA